MSLGVLDHPVLVALVDAGLSSRLVGFPPVGWRGMSAYIAIVEHHHCQCLVRRADWIASITLCVDRCLLGSSVVVALLASPQSRIFYFQRWFASQVVLRAVVPQSSCCTGFSGICIDPRICVCVCLCASVASRASVLFTKCLKRKLGKDQC